MNSINETLLNKISLEGVLVFCSYTTNYYKYSSLKQCLFINSQGLTRPKSIFSRIWARVGFQASFRCIQTVAGCSSCGCEPKGRLFSCWLSARDTLDHSQSLPCGSLHLKGQQQKNLPHVGSFFCFQMLTSPFSDIKDLMPYNKT